MVRADRLFDAGRSLNRCRAACEAGGGRFHHCALPRGVRSQRVHRPLKGIRSLCPSLLHHLTLLPCRQAILEQAKMLNALASKYGAVVPLRPPHADRSGPGCIAGGGDESGH